jgi:hypothetical protein
MQSSGVVKTHIYIKVAASGSENGFLTPYWLAFNYLLKGISERQRPDQAPARHESHLSQD